MSKHHQRLVDILKNMRLKRIMGAWSGSISDGLVVFIGFIMIFSWIDLWFPIPFNARMILRYVFIIGALIIIARNGIMPFIHFGIERMSLILQKELSMNDEIINALQFGFQKDEAGISFQLKDNYIQQTLDSVVARPIPSGWIKKSVINPLMRLAGIASIAAVMIVVPPHPLTRFFPRLYGALSTEEIYQYLDVFPKNVRIPEGKQVSIRVQTKKMLPAPFALHVRGDETSWETAEVQKIHDNTWILQIDHLTNEIHYYVRMRDLKTPVYTLTPLATPKIVHLRFVYRFPGYTGKPDKEIINEPFINALRGTGVTIFATMNIPVSKGLLHFNDGRVAATKTDSTKIQADFLLDKDGECWFEFAMKDETVKGESTRITIRIEEDRVPEITILAPAENLLTSPDQVIPITYTAEDDFGITRISLMFKKIDAPTYTSKPVKQFPGALAEYTGDYSWQIAGLMLSSGEIIEYYLEAEDNDVLSGSKKGRSETYRLEMTSYKKEHERITDQLEFFRQDIIDILGDQILAHESLKRLLERSPTDEVNPEQDNLLREIKNMQESIKDRLTQSAQTLREILPSMERDPLGDVSVYMEHSAMHNNLQAMADKDMNDILTSIDTGSLAEASDVQQSVISELEKMSLLSEDVLKRRNMQDLVNTADSMLSKSDGLIDNLENISETPTPEDMAKLYEALNKLSSMMQEISAYLNEMPQDLPDDFINQEAVQSLDMREMQSLSRSIAEALQSGDFASALQMAKALAEQAKSMLTTLRDAAARSMEGLAGSETLSSEIEKSIQDLEQIIVEQENLLGSTKKHEKLRRQRLYDEQEKLLKKLALRQAKLLSRTEILEKRIRENEPSPRYVWSSRRMQLYNAQDNMKKVLSEFNAGRVFKSQDYLVAIIADVELISVKVKLHLDSIQYDKSKENYSKEEQKIRRDGIVFYADILAEITAIKKEEEEILALLKDTSKKPQDVFKAPEKKTLNELSQSQEKLHGRTRIMTERLQEFSRQTALMGSEVFSRFRMAAGDMQSASENLSVFDTKEGVENEESALDNLLQGKQALSNALQALQQMLSGAGQPMSGFMQIPGGSGNMPGGMRGVREGHVHIPGPKEYTPPQEFREEIMKSLKENYPEMYEPVIKEYYKKLTPR